MTSLDLPSALRDYFRSYLLEQKQASPHTLKAYRDAFKVLLQFIQKHKKSTKKLSLTDIHVPLILHFLKNLESQTSGRGNSSATRNYRLAAIRSFFRYVAWRSPHLERLAKRICAIPFKKTSPTKLDFLTCQELKILFSQVNPHGSDGYRDLAILIYLFNTGARSQEVADTKISWIDFQSQLVSITGKGGKQRLIPLWPTTLQAIRTYLDRHRRAPRTFLNDFLFINQRRQPLSRFGVRGIVRKYAKKAQSRCSSLKSKRLSTHSLRHTTAMHLLESKVELNVIKAWLGHADLSSTSRYLDADITHKKAALSKFAPPIYVLSSLEQKKNPTAEQLLDWLKDF